MFGVITESKETRSGAKGNPIMSSEGDKYVVMEEPEGWVEATSSNYHEGSIPGDIKIFESYEKAETFIKRWKGHPWWCEPNGNYEILELEPVYKQCQFGFKRKD